MENIYQNLYVTNNCLENTRNSYNQYQENKTYFKNR